VVRSLLESRDRSVHFEPSAVRNRDRSMTVSSHANGEQRTLDGGTQTAQGRSARMGMAERARRASSISGCATGSDHGGMTLAA